MKYYLISFEIPVGQNHSHYYTRLIRADNLFQAIAAIEKNYPTAKNITDLTLVA